MIEMHHLKNNVIFFQTILSFVLSRKIIVLEYLIYFVKLKDIKKYKTQ